MKALLSLFLLCALPVPLQANQYNWQWQFFEATCGVSTIAKDSSDAMDIPYTPTGAPFIAVYHEYGVTGWDGATGPYRSDMRTPLLAPGQSKTWRLYMTVPGSQPQPFSWRASDYYRPAFDKITYTLTYVRCAIGGDEPSLPMGTTVVLNLQPQGEWLFPAYETTAFQSGYAFDFTATVIPEPSSLLALLAGLGGLGGMVWRRSVR